MATLRKGHNKYTETLKSHSLDRFQVQPLSPRGQKLARNPSRGIFPSAPNLPLGQLGHKG
jgi:hypothetical protein